MAMICIPPTPIDRETTIRIAIPDDVAHRLYSAKALYRTSTDSSLYYISASWKSELVVDLLCGIVSLRQEESAPLEDRTEIYVRTLILLSIVAGRPVGGVSQKEFDEFQYAYINEMSLRRRIMPRGFVDLIIQGKALTFADNSYTTDEQIRHALNLHGTKVSLLEPK